MKTTIISLLGSIVFSSVVFALPDDEINSNCSEAACSFAGQTKEGQKLAKSVSSITKKMNEGKAGVCDSYPDNDTFCKCVKKQNYQIVDNYPPEALVMVKAVFPDVQAIKYVSLDYPDYQKSTDAIFCQMISEEEYKALKLYRQVSVFYSARKIEELSDDQLLMLANAVKEVVNSKVLPGDKRKNLLPFLSKILGIEGRADEARAIAASIYLSKDRHVKQILSATSDDYKKATDFALTYLKISEDNEIELKKNTRAIAILAEAGLLNNNSDPAAAELKTVASDRLKKGMNSPNNTIAATSMEIFKKASNRRDSAAADALKAAESDLRDRLKQKECLEKDPVGCVYMAKILATSMVNGKPSKAAQTAISTLNSAISSTSTVARAEAAKTIMSYTLDETWADLCAHPEKPIPPDVGNYSMICLAKQKATAITRNILSSPSSSIEDKREMAQATLSLAAVTGTGADKELQDQALAVLKDQMNSKDSGVSIAAAQAIKVSAAPASTVAEAIRVIKDDQRLSLFSVKNTLDKTVVTSTQIDQKRSAIDYVNKNSGWGIKEGTPVPTVVPVSTPEVVYTPSSDTGSRGQPEVVATLKIPEGNKAPISDKKSSSLANAVATPAPQGSGDIIYNNKGASLFDISKPNTQVQNTIIEREKKIGFDDKKKKSSDDSGDDEEEEYVPKNKKKKPESGQTAQVQTNNQSYANNGDGFGGMPGWGSNSSQSSGNNSGFSQGQYGAPSQPTDKDRGDVADKKERAMSGGTGGGGAEGSGGAGGGSTGLSDSGGGAAQGGKVAGSEDQDNKDEKDAKDQSGDSYRYKTIIPYQFVKDKESLIKTVRALGLEGKEFKAFDSASRFVRLYDDPSLLKQKPAARNNFIKELKLARENVKFNPINNETLNLAASRVKEINKWDAKPTESADIDKKHTLIEMNKKLSLYEQLVKELEEIKKKEGKK